MAEPQYGAFGDILSLDSELDKPTLYNVFQNVSRRPDLHGEDLQNVYGIEGGIPMFQWVQQVKTGERTYDPNREEDQEYQRQYDQYVAQNPEAPSWGEAIGQIALAGGANVAGAVLEGVVNPGNLYKGDVYDRMYEGAKDTYGDSRYQTVANRYADFDPQAFGLKDNQVYFSELGDKSAIKATDSMALRKELDFAKVKEPLTDIDEGFLFDTKKTANVYDIDKLEARGYGFDPQGKLVDTYADDPYSTFTLGEPVEVFDGTDMTQDYFSGGEVTDSFATSPEDYQALTTPGITNASANAAADSVNWYDSSVDSLNWNEAAGKSNLTSAAGAGLTAGLTTFIMTGDAEKAAKTGVGTALGKAAGTAIGATFGPGGAAIGGFLGGIVGGAVGSRVICNELHNQGLITKKQLINDYKFTRDYLTTKHVNGYHLWALWMVKQMRKGKYVNFWKHIVLHRANEIAYIYGESDKPDYLGKFYRKIFEPVCWTLGLFCKETDWSILYKTKEI